MKLLCINSKPIESKTYINMGYGLEEGKIYETKGKPFREEGSDLCYYIEGLGSKLVCRFTELLEEKSKEDASIEKLKREFELN